MPLREFELTVGRDGTVEVHVRGYKGKRCVDAIKMFEKIVGEIQSQRATSEFYEPEEEVQYRVDRKV
jgi:hypothetical protein